MNYEETVAYIHSAHRNPGLGDPARFRTFLAALGDPQDSCRCIHVAGTNGKGSVCAMTDAILRAAGYRVGLYTSPYLIDFRERIRVCGEPISEEELTGCLETVLAACASTGETLSEFELITAVAFVAFARAKVDVVVLEVGLGGRLDPTNAIRSPELSIVTGIDFDHMNILGNTIQKIAAEKAGIFKEGCPALYGGEGDSACRVLNTVASLRHAPFYTVDRSLLNIRETTLDGTRFDFDGAEDLMIPLLGMYQPRNAATVLTAVPILRDAGWEIPDSAVREGLASVVWHARFERLLSDPVTIFDGAHNPEGVREAVKSIRTYFPEQKVNLLTGVMTDKNYDEMIEEMRGIAADIFTVTPCNPRALPADEYAAAFGAHSLLAVGYSDLGEGVRAAIDASRRAERPLICLGSLYLYRDLTDALKHL